MGLLAHLQTNLVQAEQLGQTDRAKKLRARIAKLEKKAEPVEEAPKTGKAK